MVDCISRVLFQFTFFVFVFFSLENCGRLKNVFFSCFCWNSFFTSLVFYPQEQAYLQTSHGCIFSSWYDALNLNNFPLSTVNDHASCWSYQECDSEWSRWNIMLQMWNYFHSSRWRCCGKDSLRFDQYILQWQVEKMTKQRCWLCEALFWRNDRNHMILNKRWKKLSQA